MRGNGNACALDDVRPVRHRPPVMAEPHGPEVNEDEPAPAEGGARKKHRHDLGHEDHGPKLAARTTRGIQTLLGLWIALTLLLVVYALVDASRT